MATSTTTQATMAALEILSDVEMERLTTPRQRDAVSATGTPFPWRIHHERAWARTVRELLDRPESIEESDLSDVTELNRAVCYLVAAYAYEAGEAPGDMERSKYFHNLHLREMSEVRLTLSSGGEARKSSVGYMTIPAKRGA